jgi:hypothetical protein
MLLSVGILALMSWIAAGWWLGEKWPKVASPLRQAEALRQWMQEWQLGAVGGKPLGQLGEVPQYKFFGRLAKAGLAHARSFGSFPRDMLWEWRDGIGKEVAFDKKWQGIVWGGLAQFALFAAITWVFIFMTQNMLEQRFPMSLLMAVAVWQLLGASLYVPLLWWLQQRRLQGFALLLECLYVLRSLGAAGLASQQVLKEARLETLSEVRSPRLLVLKERVLGLAQLYQKQGVPLVKESQLLLQETWFLREEELSRLAKLSEGIKLVFLLVFFGGSYALFLFGLVQQLLRGE